MRRVSLLLALLLPSLALAGGAPSSHSALFVGNSYTGASSPDHLGESYRQLVLEGQPGLDPVRVEIVAPGGYTLTRHYGDAQGQSSLANLLTAADPADRWDSVVLQDQSQLPAFPQTQPEWLDARDAAVGLARMVTEQGGEPLLLLTYGRREGDQQNAWRFPDFQTMNALLATGYEGYAEAILAEGMNVRIIPAGVAWAKVHSDEVAAGNDPLAAESLFTQLYTGDGSHPSVLGTFLMACVAYETIQGESCEELDWAHSGISVDDRAALAAAATWSVSNYVQPGEPAGDDDDAADDDDDDSADDDDDSADDGDDDDDGQTGCACNAVSSAESFAARGTLMLLLLVSGIRIRRQR